MAAAERPAGRPIGCARRCGKGLGLGFGVGLGVWCVAALRYGGLGVESGGGWVGVAWDMGVDGLCLVRMSVFLKDLCFCLRKCGGTIGGEIT